MTTIKAFILLRGKMAYLDYVWHDRLLLCLLGFTKALYVKTTVTLSVGGMVNLSQSSFMGHH